MVEARQSLCPAVRRLKPAAESWAHMTHMGLALNTVSLVGFLRPAQPKADAVNQQDQSPESLLFQAPGSAERGARAALTGSGSNPAGPCWSIFS